MSIPESISTPPFSWSDRDIAFVAGEIGREFPSATMERVVSAVEAAAKRVPPNDGRVSLAKMTRQILREKET